MDITTQIMTLYNSSEEWNLESFMNTCKNGIHKLRVVVPSNSRFGIVRYVKEYSDFTQPETPYFRSIVFDKTNGKVVSVAPQKSVSPVNNWKQPDVGDWSNVDRVEEFIDGTMINIFQVAGDSTITIATRSRVGGNTTFYEGGATFEEMLRDTSPTLDTFFEEKQEGVYSRFVSLVLQHPMNRIVVPVAKPAIYVIHTGVIKDDGSIHLNNQAFSQYRPLTHDVEKMKSIGLQNYLRNLEVNHGIKTQGVVVYMKDGTRARYRTHLYEHVRRIRGNESQTYERFARLRREAAFEKYLQYYPEEKDVFYQMEGRLRSQTRNLFTMYMNVFVKRAQKYDDCPWPFKHHVSILHNLYKLTLKGQNQKVDLQFVISYVNRLLQEDMNNILKIVKPKGVDMVENYNTPWLKPSTEGLRNAPPLPDE